MYREHLQDPETSKMPTLQTLYDLLCSQPEGEAVRLATALEIYVSGSLNVFNQMCIRDSDFIIADAAARYFRENGISKLPSYKALQAEIESLIKEKKMCIRDSCAPCRGRCVLRPRWEATLPKPLVRSAQPDTHFAFVRLHRACYPLTERRCSP